MIRIKNVSKYYYSKKSVTLALRKINLDFQKGEFVVITGESGSGKTTLLNVISGMDSYEEGELYVGDQATSHFDKQDWENLRRDKIGFVYQNYNLIDSFTAFENVESALLIQEDVSEDRKDKVFAYLEEVGLSKYAHKKAANLSSGQKQRLSIARALAKETEIIVADEPTGNLDSQNGKQIMELLYELSKEKLVIVVTHNFDQAKEYATRRIRLFNGEVADDILVKQPEVISSGKGSTKPEKSQKEANKAHRAVSRRFVSLNRKAQPHRTVFISALMLFISISFFIFFGGFASNLDSATSMKYDSKAFPNGDMTRLVLRNIDGSAFDSKDVKTVSEVKHVDQVDLYDTVNDINYFYKEDKDYKFTYTTNNTSKDMPNTKSVTLKEFKNYMRSATCITKDDLSDGRLPKNSNEVVVSSDDEKLLGKTVSFYMCNLKVWGKEQYVNIEAKVVGVTKEDGSQVYFDEQLCKSLVEDKESGTSYYTLNAEEGRGLTVSEDELLTADTDIAAMIEAGSVIKAIENPVYVINPDLTGNETRLSSEFYDNNVYVGTGASDTSSNRISVNQFKIFNQALFQYTQDDTITQLPVHVVDEEGGSGTQIVEVSPDLYDTLFANQNSVQMTVYMDDYAYTDRVIKDIKELGYEVLSVYRVGAVSPDPDLVMERLVSAGISLVSFIVVFFLGMLIVYSLMKLKRKDFIILKSLGMDQKMVGTINYIDIISLIGMTSVLSILVSLVLSACGVSYVYNLVKYYQWYHYLILIFLNLLFGTMTAVFFNRYLKRKDKLTSLIAE